jgi:hypothetical protein
VRFLLTFALGFLWMMPNASGDTIAGFTYLRRKNPPMREQMVSRVASGNVSVVRARIVLQRKRMP